MLAIAAKKRKKPLDPGQISANEVNPNYALDTSYQVNCQRCAPTFELNCRGWKVEAKPSALTHDGENLGTYEYNHTADSIKLYYKTLNKKDLKLELHIYARTKIWLNTKEFVYKKKQDIIDEMLKWGEGARAEISCWWDLKAKRGHVFNAFVKGGKVHFVDVQGPNRNAEDYFNNIKYSTKYVNYNTFWRTDDAIINPEYIEDICKAKR